MENKQKKTFKISENERLSQPKFKALNKNLEYHELQSKYDVYKNGSPNNYKQDLQSLKAYHIKNNIKTVETPTIEYLLQQIKNIPENAGTNLRDYSIHPSMIQKYSNRFKNMVSDQQEMQDFLAWFRKKQKEIQSRNCGLSEKFYLNQSLVAAGFNQIISQISCISKVRSEVLKMLWNKQNGEVEQIISIIHKQNLDFQKNNLETVKALHLGYQDQIITLKQENYCLEKKIQQATILNEGCINSLRIMRKQIKKYQKIIKELTDTNFTLKQQSLQLLQENINILMKQKNIPYQKARILTYQKMHLQRTRKSLHKNKGFKHIVKDVKNKAQNMIENSQVMDLEEKKQKLVKFIKNRFKQNPTEKNFIMKGQFSQSEDEDIKLQKNVEKVLKSKQLKLQIQQKLPKPLSLLKQIGINTQPNVKIQQIEQNKSFETVGIQTQPNSDKDVIDLLTLNTKQEQEGKKKLRDKKVMQRHTLMMIQMNKMMEFKKVDTANKIRRLTRLQNISNSQQIANICKPSRFNSRNDSEQISQQSEGQSAEQQNGKQNHIQLWKFRNKRQQNIRRTHHQSIISQKSYQFQKLVSNISHQNISFQGEASFSRRSNLKQEQRSQQEIIEQSENIGKEAHKNSQQQDKLMELKQLVKKYVEKKGNNCKQQKNNPQKSLKKILTDTFKNLYICKKSNFLQQMARTAKNSYGKIVYENKLVHHIAMILEHKQKSLLAALDLLLLIDVNPEIAYEDMPGDDLNDLYFKIYFNLSLKIPTQNQFNIWNNYTSIQRLTSGSFLQILRLYFHENKCMYLQLKIKQFIGIACNNRLPGRAELANSDSNSNSNYYVQLNPLMMYILEVYLSQKRNYYQSYHQIIDFLSLNNFLDLQIFIFLLDLLCLKQEQQKQIISAYYGMGSKTNNFNSESPFCHKDIFYQVCIKYQLPLFQFIKILKLEQFKNLHEYIQNDFVDINDSEKWKRVKDSLEKRLKNKNKYCTGLKKIIERLDNYIRASYKVQNQPFLFFYRIVIFTAFG